MVPDRTLEPSDATTRIVTTGHTVMFDRQRVPWRFRNDPAMPAPIEPRYALVVPFHVEGRVAGTISVVRDRTDLAFAPDDEALLQMMAEVVALRIGPLVGRPALPVVPEAPSE